MSLSTIFEDRVNSVEKSGVDLFITLLSMSNVAEALPENDELAEQQRRRRNELRAEGHEIDFSDMRSCGGTKKEDGEGELRDGGKDNHQHTANAKRPADDAADGRSCIHNEDGSQHNSNTHLTASEGRDDERNNNSYINSSSSSSSSSFVSPTSIRSAQRLLSADFAASVENDDLEAGNTCSPLSDAEVKARLAQESTVQLLTFDHDPKEWLLGFLCVASKMFGEESMRYREQCQQLRNLMSVRRRRIQLRSAVLLDRQKTKQKAQQEGKEAEDDESDTKLTDDELQRAAVPIPESLIRHQSDILSSFLSAYIAIMMREEVPVTILKRVCEQVFHLCHSLRTYPLVPVDVVGQLHEDLTDQANTFLMQWITLGDGRLEPIMLSRPPETKVTDREGSEASWSGSESLDEESSTVGSESVMDSEGRPLHRTTTTTTPADLAAEATEGTEAAATAAPGEAAEAEVKDKNGDGGQQSGTDAPLTSAAAAMEAEGDAACPPVDMDTAMELIREHCNSRSPCRSRLTQLVLDSVPGMTRTALLPCIEQPERHAFNEGYVRLARFITAAEVALLTKWMQVRLTEIGDSWNSDKESALMRAWASPDFDPEQGELTVLVNPTNAFRMQLSNPSCFSPSKLQCDMCCLAGRTVAFQAVLNSGVYSEVFVVGHQNCVGFDMCMACSYDYYKACEVRLLRAVHPNAAMRQPFAYGQYSKIVVQSLRVTHCAQTADEQDADNAVVVVEVTMAVSPLGVLPIGWVLPHDRVAALGQACTSVAADDYVELTEAEHAALPAPDAAWQARCHVTNISRRAMGVGKEGKEEENDGNTAESPHTPADVAEADVCPICLQQLRGTVPVLRTRCGHCFHVACIGSYYHGKPTVVNGDISKTNVCPMCRSSDYMPSLTDVAETLRTNVYKLELRVPTAAVPCAVAVGTILTRDGVYHNATNIAACTAFYDLMPGYLYASEDTTGDSAADVAAASHK